MKSKKREKSHSLFQREINLFRCPICRQKFLPSPYPIMQCVSGHNFDLARNGYLNLLTSPQTNGEYSRELFLARRQVFSVGIFDLLVDRIAVEIRARMGSSWRVADFGCGEGSFLVKLSRCFPGLLLLGLDISREAIRLAASSSAPALWCVADLACLPLKDNSFDLLLNILAPANYGEFRRSLKPNGLIIKVWPGPDYLQEVRVAIGADTYCEQGVRDNFCQNIQIEWEEHLYYQVPLNNELWPLVLRMTPLTTRRTFVGQSPELLTIDLNVLGGTFK